MNVGKLGSFVKSDAHSHAYTVVSHIIPCHAPEVQVSPPYDIKHVFVNNHWKGTPTHTFGPMKRFEIQKLHAY